MKKTKKSQFFLLSGFLLISIFTFIYSLETENSYIGNSAQNQLVNNILFESCEVGTQSNGSTIHERFSDLTSNVSTYCSSIGISCNLSIENTSIIPSNLSDWSYLNYTFYLDYDSKSYGYDSNFTC